MPVPANANPRVAELEHLCSSTLLFSYRAHLAGEGINLGVTPNGARYALTLGY